MTRLQFQMASLWFFPQCWSTIKLDAMGTEFDRTLNVSFIVNIPKKEGAASIGYCKPISQVESIYKIICKVLSNKLKKVLDEIVSYSQKAFVKGR